MIKKNKVVKKSMKNRKKKIKKNFFIILFVVLLGGVIFLYLYNNKILFKDADNNIENDTKNIVIKHYNKYVITNKEANIYNEDEEVVGSVGKDIELVLDDMDINNDTKYFKIKEFDLEYYIKYEDVDVIDELSLIDDRYKNYIVFNENVVTLDNTKFYDEDDNLVYEFNKSFDLPIIIKEDDRYGVEFNNRLLYVKNGTAKDNDNTLQTNSSGVAVLNYHAFYDEENSEEVSDCVTEICHSKAQFKTHLDYIKDNNILTLKMKELEMYIDGKIRLPKSVLITIDDGPKTEHAVDMLTEYKMYATIFLVTSWYDINSYYKTDYIELHSHTDSLHDGGKCPGGQGSGLKCLDEETLLNDLRTSREKLNNTTYFCYPFYEYNEFSTEILKKAGFTMAFIGESNYSDNLVHVGDDKFKLRRFVIVTYTTMNDLDNYFGQIY